MVQSSSGVKEHPLRRTQQTERLRKIVKAEDMVRILSGLQCLEEIPHKQNWDC